MDPFTIFGVVSSVLSASAAIAQGKEIKAQKEAEARQIEQERQQTIINTMQKHNDRLQEFDNAMDINESLFAFMNRDDDRSLKAFRENEKLIASDDARRIDTQGLYRGEQLRLQAASARRAGRSAEKMGYLNGAVSLFGGLQDAYKYRKVQVQLENLMVSVVKQRRQFQNTQIGINRADMSVANDLGRVSQLADQITNRMFREAADNAAKSTKQFIDEMPNNAIYGVDPKTGRPKVIDFQESLPSKGYGTYAQDLIKKGIDERFTRLATNEYKEKSAEFASKYPFSPTKYKEEMSRFVSEMKKPYSGKYANLIEIGATEWIGRTQAVILENAIKNQRRLAGLDLSNSLNDFSKDIASIGIGGGTDSKQMLAMIDEYVSSNSEAIASMRNMGNFRQTPKQVADAL